MRHQQPRHRISAPSQPTRRRTTPAGNIQHDIKGFRNESECLSVGSSVPAQATKPTPSVRPRPSHYACFTELLFPLGKRGSVAEQRGSNCKEMLLTEYVGSDEIEVQTISHVYDEVIEEAQLLEDASFPQCSGERGSTMNELGTSAYSDTPLRLLKTKENEKGQHDHAAIRTNDGCARDQPVPYDVKKKLLHGTPAGPLQSLHIVDVFQVLCTPRHLGISRSSGVQLSPDPFDVRQLHGRLLQLRVSSMRSRLRVADIVVRATSARIVQTCGEVELTPLDNGTRNLVMATGTTFTVEWLDCVCCRTLLCVSRFNDEQASLYFNQYHQSRTPSEEAHSHKKWQSLFDRQYGQPWYADWSKPRRQHRTASGEERQPESRI